MFSPMVRADFVQSPKQVPEQRTALWDKIECSPNIPEAPHGSVFRPLRLLFFTRYFHRCDGKNYHLLHRWSWPGSSAGSYQQVGCLCWCYVLCLRLNHMPWWPKAKYCLPRDPCLRTAYRNAKQQRPRLKLHGIWTFGTSLRIEIIEESQRAGSAMVCELIALAMEDAMTLNDVKPECLIVVGDNTVKELKNKFCLSMLMNYVSHLRLKWFGLNWTW